jgi:hypothetical protein
MNSVIYKNAILDLPMLATEDMKEYSMRKWFVMKNIEYTNEFQYCGKKDALMAYDDLIRLSRIYAQVAMHDCTFSHDIMKKLNYFVKDVFVA